MCRARRTAASTKVVHWEEEHGWLQTLGAGQTSKKAGARRTASGVAGPQGRVDSQSTGAERLRNTQSECRPESGTGQGAGSASQKHAKGPSGAGFPASGLEVFSCSTVSADAMAEAPSHRERYHLTLPRTTRRIPCKIKQTISPWTLCRPCLGGALLHLDKYSWTELFTQPTHACRGKTILFPRPELCLEQTSIFWALLVIDFTVFWSAHAAKTVSISTSLERPGIWRLSSPRTGGQPEGPPSWQARSAWAEARQ
jgi:hypothetical protein